MKSLKKLDRKLNWYPRIKKAFLGTLLAAGLLVPVGAFGVPLVKEANYKWAQQQELQELLREPVPESFIADVKEKSLDNFIPDSFTAVQKDGIWSYQDTKEYERFKKQIKKVSEETGVPAYVLAGIVDYCQQCSSGPDAFSGWGGRTPITPEEAGIKGSYLWKDPEQDILSGAGKFKRLLREVGDETIAIALMFEYQFYHVRKNIKDAKTEAADAYACLKEYQKWRSISNAKALEKYDALVKQRNALTTKDWEKKSKLEDNLKVLFDEITVEKPIRSADLRGNYQLTEKKWHPDLFKVTIQPEYWKYKCWWVNNLYMGCGAVKIALRLKRDGY